MLKVKFDTDNEAFGNGNGGLEVARILRKLARHIEDSRDSSGNLFDANGNRVGHWSLSLSDE